MKTIRTLLALLLVLALGVPVSFGETAADGAAEDTRSWERKTFPLYLTFYGTVPYMEEFPLYFVDGVNDMPYVDISDVLACYNKRDEENDPDVLRLNAEYDQEGGEVTIRLGENTSSLCLNFAEQYVSYSSFDTFHSPSYESMMDNLYSSGFNEAGEPELFRRISSVVLQREGNPLFIDMKEYDIPMIRRDGLFLMPMHTAFDLIIGMPTKGKAICFNGQAVFFGYITELGKETELGQLYYSVQADERSPELTSYGLNELCMELDYFYGLKEVHGVTRFFDLLLNSGLAKRFLDLSANEADKALAMLLSFYLDDGHSGYRSNSWMTGTDPEVNPETVKGGFSAVTGYYTEKVLLETREKYPDSKLPYFEVGNTAYICQDSFHMYEEDPGAYYKGLTEEQIAKDTIALIIYAHDRITREDSPIENVVIDLSCNSGGDVDAAIFMMSWFLGEAPFSSLNPITGAQRTALYQADVNLDRVFDEKDTLDGLNLYCLISPLSFSCANLVPWVFKSSGKVTLIGDTTGGGSCVVLPMTSAWGSMFQISGYSRCSFVKNGSYYDVDRGVDPDVPLTKAETFCDREKLTEIINNLY